MLLVVGNGVMMEEFLGNILLILVLKEVILGIEVFFEFVGIEFELKVGNGGVMEEGLVGIEKIFVFEYVGVVDNFGVFVEFWGKFVFVVGNGGRFEGIFDEDLIMFVLDGDGIILFE